jgi:orotidine-5'-phosphate decarboxylase
VDGFVGPATRPERIAALRARAPGLLAFATGAGTQGGSAYAAAKAGADFVIVGRSIAQAQDPAAAAASAAAEITRGRTERGPH